MTVKAFTYTQAQEIAEDFEDLVDTEHRRVGETYVIDDIIIRPYDAVKAHQNLDEYYGAEEIQLETVEDPDAMYAVLVIMSSIADGSIFVQDITDYVAANGVNYNFPS